ncbi:Protein phosphatase PhpP [Chlamydiales bacterium SCGC AG-110-M15]|nr:Protein phosphatase PhpP [Chlamydiales bacterium SCGC AG-110-M15]
MVLMDKRSLSFQIQSFGVSDKGLVRVRNEDYWDSVPEKNIFALADGMGGHLGGDVAAKEAVTFSLDLLSNSEILQKHILSPDDVLDVMRFVIQQTNARVHERSKLEPTVKGMGATLCCFYLYENRYAVYAHVGDSRIYRLRKGEFKQLTSDHSVVQEMMDAGQLKKGKDKAAKRKYAGMITKAIGIDPKVRAEADFEEIQHGDIYLMCSDGLTNMLRPAKMQELIENAPTIEDASQSLVKAAKNGGGDDNITAVLLSCEEES